MKNLVNSSNASQYCSRYEAARLRQHPQAHSACLTLLTRSITILIASAFLTTTTAQTTKQPMEVKSAPTSGRHMPALSKSAPTSGRRTPALSKSAPTSGRRTPLGEWRRLPHTPTLLLAEQLTAEKQYRNAAIEYRRLALSATDENQKAGYYWGAAYMYHINHDNTLAIKMLDFSEDASSIFEQEATLLRLDSSIAQGNKREARFYAESLAQSATNELKHIAQSRRTKLAIMNHNTQLANSLIPANASKETIYAIKTYTTGHDKSPRLGGFLGMIPGLGYAYSGEYANALRSLIMNGLFIYAMVDTAEDDNWGIFSVITFFEITWYSGSIYGGLDSAHRHNRNRLQACLQVIDDQSQYKPDLRKMPAISFKYSF